MATTEFDAAYAEAEYRIAEAKRAHSTTLDLSGYSDNKFNALTRIPPAIGELVDLEYLTLAETRVSDLSPLAQLYQLETLVLRKARVTDLTPLVHLTSLQKIDISDTPIADLRPLCVLAELARIRTLDVRDLAIGADLQPAARPPFVLFFLGVLARDLDPRIREVLNPYRISSYHPRSLAEQDTIDLLKHVSQRNDRPDYATYLVQSMETKGIARAEAESRVSRFTPEHIAHELALALIGRAKATRATELSLNGHRFFGLFPLQAMPSEASELVDLHALDLSNTQVTDLSPLQNLQGLTRLHLENTRVTDLSPLSGLTALTKLVLPRHAEIADVSPLARMTRMTELSLSDTAVADLTPLSGMSAMQKLDLARLPIADLSPLARMSSLTDLNIAYTRVADLSPLAGCVDLVNLDCSETPVSDLSPLAGMGKLETLEASAPRISDLGPLAGLTGLRNLAICGSGVSDLKPLEGMTALVTFFATAAAAVEDLAPLAAATRVTTLHVALTKVADLGPLANMAELNTLSIAHTRVWDLSPIANAKQLVTLELDATLVADLRPIRTLWRLNELELGFADCLATQIDPQLDAEARDRVGAATLPYLRGLDDARYDWFLVRGLIARGVFGKPLGLALRTALRRVKGKRGKSAREHHHRRSDRH